jgi:hypothetical protein
MTEDDEFYYIMVNCKYINFHSNTFMFDNFAADGYEKMQYFIILLCKLEVIESFVHVTNGIDFIKMRSK